MQSAHEAAGAAGIRRSPRPPWAEGNSNASDASRREIADARLDLFCCLKIVSEIQSAQHSLTTLHKKHPSCPDLIHGCPVRFEWTKRMAWILLCFERSATFETRKGTHAMRHHNSVFHSLLKHVPWHKLEQAVEKHDADALSRKLDTKRHFIALLYGQISGAASLREVVTGMASHETRLYHVGATPVKRSTRSGSLIPPVFGSPA